MAEQIEQDALEREGLDVTRAQLGGGDLRDKIGLAMPFRIFVVKPVHILYEGQILTAKTFRQQKCTRIAAMGRNAPERRGMLPQGVWRHCRKDDAGGGVDEQRQKVSEQMRWN